jgi:hypothetical protein
MIRPKNDTRQANKTLRGSRKTPALTFPGIQAAIRLTEVPEETAGISVNAKNAVIAAIATTKAFLALVLARAIRGTKTLDANGRVQTSHGEKSEKDIIV